MNPLAWLLGLALPACGFPGAQGLPTPPPMDTAHITRPASPNTALAAPAGFSPAPDIVTPRYHVPANRLFELVQAIAAAQPRTAQAALYPDQLQVHYVVRSAILNFPDLVMAQVRQEGPDSSDLVLYSRSVYGYGDFGVNRKRVAAWIGQLQTKRPYPARDDPFMRGIGPFLKDAWHLARPYFTTSEERWSARGLLVAIIAMNLTLVGLSVVLSFWRREFYNALQNKDWRSFLELLFLYRNTPSGLLPGFCEVAAVHIVLAVYSVYVNQLLQIRWRRWLTGKFLTEWMDHRAYYRIGLTTDRAAVGTDNPDQRIAEDLRDFTDVTLSLGLGLLSNLVSLGSFIGILWGLSGAIEVMGIPIPGYMVWVALAYAVIGTWLTHLVGRPLALLSFKQQRVEADFRYGLVRFRENMESIALYRGEQEEGVNLRERFGGVIANWRQIMTRTKLLNSLVVGYDQVAVIFPIVVAAPRYFSGAMQLGGLMQTVGSFGSVQSSMSWFIGAYAQLATWRAIVERLSTFHSAILKAHAATEQGFLSVEAPDGNVHLHDVTMSLPDGTKLLDRADLVLTPGHSIVITGRSGAGKTTLFRSLAGIWPFGSGRVQIPRHSFFLPQRPYVPLGTLRHVITYPNAIDSFTDEEMCRVLCDVGMPQLVDRLDHDDNWPMRLSMGEQQRLGFARALLARPDWIFLDEATASVDPEAETDLYRVLKERLPDATLVSIAHRPSVAQFHERRLAFRREGNLPGTMAESPVLPEPAGE